MKTPSKERGCEGKTNLGSTFVKQADRFGRKNGKIYGVYRCPHCLGTHLTTKLENRNQYNKELLYVSKLPQKTDNEAFGWLTISTAPKDGEPFLAREEDGAIYKSRFLEWYDEEAGMASWSCEAGQHVSLTPEPTHWMPLPYDKTIQA